MNKLFVRSICCQVLDMNYKAVIDILSQPSKILLTVCDLIMMEENVISSLVIFTSDIDVGWDRLMFTLAHTNCKIEVIQIYDIKPASHAYMFANALCQKVNSRELRYTSIKFGGVCSLQLSSEMITLVSNSHLVLNQLTLLNMCIVDPSQFNTLRHAIMRSNIPALDITFLQSQDDMHDYTAIEKCVKASPQYAAIRKRMSIMLNPTCTFRKLPPELFNMLNELFM